MGVILSGHVVSAQGGETEIRNLYYDDKSIYCEVTILVTKLAPHGQMALLRHDTIATTNSWKSP